MNKANQRIHYVYAFLRAKDSKGGPKLSPYYIGKGCKDRAYRKAQRHIPAPQDRSYVVFIEEGLTEREALDLEIYCIALYGRINTGTGILRNLTDGGEGVCGVKFSEDTKRKLSAINMGKKLSDETKAKISRAGKGRSLREDTKQKIGEANTCNVYELTSPAGEKYITSNLSDFARQHNLCVPNLCAVAAGKRNHSQGWKVVLLKCGFNGNRTVGTETRARIAKAKESKQYELISPNGETFVTTNLSAFSREHGLMQTMMSAVVNGKRKRHRGWTGRILGEIKPC